jgi:glycosyltransferase involved in cell wall biosynthesis
MKIVLILMVRNEERILQRCLEAASSIADEFCICDTGSIDKTCEIAEEFLMTHPGCLTRAEWRDFGFNRSFSFTAAQEHIKNTHGEEALKDYYGLLLDGDLVFVPGTLKEQPLVHEGYTIIQCGGNLEYPNTRLVRMDYPWKCVGVTHEYWSGPTLGLSKEICYIDDRNDGGCKADKFERDMRLLERGLEEEPNNVRYMFYLAQTYHGLGRLRDSINMYKRRIAAGNWDEEIWYSHYMIGQTHLTMGNIPKFEEWMLRAHAFRSHRAEPLYRLAKYFREHGEHYKAYEYSRKGHAIPYPTDSLFIEKDVYTGLFDYEMSILDYYVKSDKSEGRRSSVSAMLKTGSHQDNIVSNLQFYVFPPKNMVIKPFEAISVFGPEYKPSAISVSGSITNTRFINYWMEGGDYKMPPGDCVRTLNACGSTPMTDTIAFPRRDAAVKGLEDLRLYRNSQNELCFVATTAEYDGGSVRVMRGKYDYRNGVYVDYALMKNYAPCEKNWLPIDGTDNIIYNWHPLKIGKVVGCELEFNVIHKTPPMFSLFRGSAPPICRGNELWTLVHFVKYDTPRKYYHCFVSLDSETYKPKAITLPFVFRSASIEYCISCRFVNEDFIECNVSFMDTDSSVATFPVSSLEWVSI